MNIRLVCMDGSAGLCDHVYKDGAQDTVVRLPNEVRDIFLLFDSTPAHRRHQCGRMPFARIAREWDSEDQTIPTGVLVRRAEDGSLPIVKAMALDTEFSAVGAEK